jgi:hypothetical protein
MLGVYAIIYLIVNAVESRFDARRLVILDMINDDESNMDLVISPTQYFHMINLGFQNSHPVCLD